MTTAQQETQYRLGELSTGQVMLGERMDRIEHMMEAGFKEIKELLQAKDAAAVARAEDTIKLVALHNEDTRARLTKIEANEQQRRGVYWALGVLGGALFTCVGWAVSFFK